jgi:hypothetical protein
MGFFVDDDPGFRRNTATAAPLAPPRPDVSDTFDAAMRQSNVVASLYNRLANSGPFEPDPSHNPLDTIRGTPFERQHLDHFVGSRSEAETRAIMRRIDGEENDRKMLEAAGGAGVVLSMLAGTADPTILLPGSIAVRAGRGGYEFTRAAINVGAAGALQAGVQESVLQATQETRTAKESLLNVASGTVLAGLIGGAASKLLTPVERQALESSLDRARADMDAHANPAPRPGIGEPVPTFAPPLIPEPSTARAPNVLDTAAPPLAPEPNQIAPLVSPAASTEPLHIEFYKSGKLVSGPNEVVPHGAEGDYDITRRSKGSQPYGPSLSSKEVLGERLNPLRVENKDDGVFVLRKLSVPGLPPKLVMMRSRILAENGKGGLGRNFQQSEFWLVDWDQWVREPGRVLTAARDKLRAHADSVSEAASDRLNAAPLEFAPNVGGSGGEVRGTSDVAGHLAQGGGTKSFGLKSFANEDEFLTSAARSLDNLVATKARDEADKILSRLAIVTGYPSGMQGMDVLRFQRKNEAAAPAPVSEGAGLGVATSAGAAATDVRTLEMPTSIPGTSRLSVTRRTLEAESVVARRAMADTATTPYSYKDSVKGIAAYQGKPVDLEVQQVKAGTQYAVGQEMDRLFTEYRFGAEPPRLARMQAGIQDITGAADGKMSYGDFKKAVSEAMMFGDAHEIPQVTAAAQFIRAKLEPWVARAETAVEGFKRLEPAAGESWFPHAWNKEKVKARRPEFTDRLTELYKGDQQTKAAAKERLTKLNDDLNAADEALSKAKTPEAAATAQARRDAARARIEEEIAAWEGKSVAEAKSAIKAREKYAADAERADDAARLTGADKSIDRAVKKILASDRDLSDQELRSIAQQTVDRILGSPDGRLPYDAVTSSRGSAFGDGEQQRGSLAHRQLNVPNAWAREWIEDDIEQVVNSHLRTFVPDVVIAERHGDVEMTQVTRAVMEDYARLIDQTKSEKQATKLGKERDAVIRDLAAVRDRIRGTYGYNPGMENLGRITTALKQVNNITSMGMSAIASIADFAGAPIRYGLTTAFADGWAPFFKNMVSANPALEKQRTQLKALGIGVDTALNIRQHAMDDIIDGYRPQSRVERALQWTSDKFFVANMLAPLTDIQKRIAGSVAINEALRGVKAVTEGKATKSQIRNLADAGIDANMASRIHRQFFENGFGETVDGVHVPNTGDWTDAGARAAFEGAIGRDVDIMVISPGQEKPLLMSSPVGSLLLQFKSFPAAATERILISNLQRRDAKALSGVITSVALGMLSYKINSMLGGQPVSDRPQDWVKEGISRSGLIGWLEEGNAMAAKLSRGTLDVHRLYGADKPLSRFASRSLADTFLGPTAGKLAGIGQVGGAAFSGEWNQSDTTALRRLMFFQNVFFLRQAINQVESSANSAFGIPEKEKTTR